MNAAKPAAPTLLLIDDSAAELRVLIDMLAARKWRTFVCFDGPAGFQKAVLKQPDLILLDVRMPNMDGFSTLRRLKADRLTEHIPVIFLSSAEAKEDRLTGFSLGAVDYIIKPYVSEEEVMARLSIHLDISRRLSDYARRNASEADSNTTAYLSLVKVATGLLLDNLVNPPSTAALAAQLGTNEKRLNELFNAEFSLPVFAWVREQRLQQARQLLSQTESPIADIAEHCGYASPANFSTAFRERFDCTPRDIRRGLAQSKAEQGGEGHDDTTE
jgi:DNA-binding response OmpR family regulator